MEDLAQTAIEAALNVGASFVDIRIENTTTTIIEINDAITKQSIASRMKGAGIRAFIDGAWAFAQTTNLSSEGIRSTGESVARLALATRDRVEEKFQIHGPSFEGKFTMTPKKPFSSISIDEKMDLVRMIDDQARDYDKRIVSTRSIYGELWSEIHIANSLGTNVSMQNSVPRIISVPTAKEGANRQRMQKSIGLRGGFEEMETEAVQNIGT
ncbi:MAG: PmbA/TldA family metallopeptidase, partial [Candidatus Thorarchaeota archaeon]